MSHGEWERGQGDWKEVGSGSGIGGGTLEGVSER